MPARKTPSAGPKPDKLMRDALMIALKREAVVKGKKTIQLTRLVEKMVEKAAGGDAVLIKEIFDRVDGKVPQAVTGKDGRDLFAMLAAADLAKLDAKQLENFEDVLRSLNATFAGS